MGETIRLKSPGDGFEFTALHAEARGHRRGGIVVIQEIFGIDKYVEEDVARWAALGFEAVAPSMFDRKQVGFHAEHDEAGIQRGVEALMSIGFDKPLEDLQACIDYLAPRGPVFMVGYCFGGLMTWLAAGKLDGLAAGSSYYGGRIGDNAELTPKCPVICHFGHRDAHIPAEAVKAKLAQVQPQVPVYIYENSGHGFNNDGRPDSDPGDARLARERTLALFEANGAG